MNIALPATSPRTGRAREGPPPTPRSEAPSPRLREASASAGRALTVGARTPRRAAGTGTPRADGGTKARGTGRLSATSDPCRVPCSRGTVRLLYRPVSARQRPHSRERETARTIPDYKALSPRPTRITSRTRGASDRGCIWSSIRAYVCRLLLHLDRTVGAVNTNRVIRKAFRDLPESCLPYEEQYVSRSSPGLREPPAKKSHGGPR